jgi:hypothetical protein
MTTSAGACLSACYDQFDESLNEHINVIIVVLGAPDMQARFDDIVKLFDYYK